MDGRAITYVWMDDREDELGCRALGIDGRSDGTTLRRGLFFPNASRLPNHVGVLCSWSSCYGMLCL